MERKEQEKDYLDESLTLEESRGTSNSDSRDGPREERKE